MAKTGMEREHHPKHTSAQNGIGERVLRGTKRSEDVTNDKDKMKRLLNELLYGIAMVLSAGAVLVLIWMLLIGLFSVEVAK